MRPRSSHDCCGELARVDTIQVDFAGGERRGGPDTQTDFAKTTCMCSGVDLKKRLPCQMRRAALRFRQQRRMRKAALLIWQGSLFFEIHPTTHTGSFCKVCLGIRPPRLSPPAKSTWMVSTRASSPQQS